jgi:hypothetical protein
MSKTIAIRVSDEVHAALVAHLATTGLTMTELLTPVILGVIELPVAAADPIEVRMMALEDRVSLIAMLETQMKMVVDRLDAIDLPNRTKEQLETAIVDPALLNSGSNPVEPRAINSKISSESSRDLNKADTSSSEFTQYVEPLLRAYASGGYYFRFDDIGQPELRAVITKQANYLGFKSIAVRIDGKSTRVWLNRDYCLQAADQTSKNV